METIKGPSVRGSLETTGLVKGLAKSHLPPLFVNKVLLEQSHAPSFIIYGYFYVPTAELCNCNCLAPKT